MKAKTEKTIRGKSVVKKRAATNIVALFQSDSAFKAQLTRAMDRNDADAIRRLRAKYKV